jgi:hypothetical protein
VTGNLLSSAAQQGQQYNNAAAATASGYVGGANAWSNGINGATNNLSNLALISQLGKSGGNPYQNLYGAQQLSASGAPLQYLSSNPLTSMVNG